MKLNIYDENLFATPDLYEQTLLKKCPEKVLDDKIQHKKKLNKIFIFSSVIIIVAIIIYSLI